MSINLKTLSYSLRWQLGINGLVTYIKLQPQTGHVIFSLKTQLPISLLELGFVSLNSGQNKRPFNYQILLFVLFL